MTTHRHRLLSRALRSVAVAATVVLATSAATADVVTSADILRITFTIDNNFMPEPPDLLRLNFGPIQVIEPYTRRIAELYNGNTLLGTAMPGSFGGFVGELYLVPSNAFKAPGSLWTFDEPATVNFTTILNGTIQGRIDWHPQTGSVDIPLNQINLELAKATSANGWITIEPTPTITSIEVVGGCLADIDGDGTVGFSEILRILAAWGCTNCPEDIDGSGTVGFGDILIVLAAWGPC